MFTDQKSFNEIYWNSFAPAVRALRLMEPEGPSMLDPNGRTETAITLAQKGYHIDYDIHVLNDDPYMTMTLRQNYGYTWVPCLLMPPVQMVPGVTSPGMIAYDPNNPPSGAIKVSLDTNDYPAYDPPAPPIVIAPPQSLVGIRIGLNTYSAVVGATDALNDGDQYKDVPRGIFTFHEVESPFAPNGVKGWFTLNVSVVQQPGPIAPGGPSA